MAAGDSLTLIAADKPGPYPGYFLSVCIPPLLNFLVGVPPDPPITGWSTSNPHLS